MIDLADIFSSKTRVKILRTLFSQTLPVPLRHLSYMTDTPVFAIQHNLAQMLKEKIVIRKRKSRFALFSLNQKHPSFNLLKNIFYKEKILNINERAKSFNHAAMNTLNFCNAAAKLLAHPKRV